MTEAQIRIRPLRGSSILLAAAVLGFMSNEPRNLDALERLPEVVGKELASIVEADDTLLDIAFRYGVGFEALIRRNPGIDVWIPDPGTVIHIPSQAIPPIADREGLVINVPEMRLFDFTADEGPAMIAAAVGTPDVPTPTGDFRISDKRIDPVWSVPKSIQLEKPHLPPKVPPGPDNPLGSRWMRIGKSAYGIHGTNIRWSVGREATHGCVRLYESDVQALFDRIPEGTRLQIVYQPYKWGRRGAQLLFEAHPDRYHRFPDPLAEALRPIRALELLDRVDVDRVWQAIEESAGVPVVVGSLPP